MKILGAGGFGKTYLVTENSQFKVLKVLHKNDAAVVSMFQQEAKALMNLRHSGIPAVEKDGYFSFLPKNSPTPLLCLVMEFIEGENLQEWMKKRRHRPISPVLAIDWLKQITDILDEMHRCNYFHRDIKPHNIIRTPNGQMVLVDFGTIQEIEVSTVSTKTMLKTPLPNPVSPGYTPPEQIEGRAIPQSDFYALGRTFAYLLTGKLPSVTVDPNTDHIPWATVAPKLPQQITNLLDYLTDPDPYNRPDNVDVLRYTLDGINTDELIKEATPVNTSAPQNNSQIKTKWAGSLLKSQQLMIRWAIASVCLIIGLMGWQFVGYRQQLLLVDPVVADQTGQDSPSVNPSLQVTSPKPTNKPASNKSPQTTIPPKTVSKPPVKPVKQVLNLTVEPGKITSASFHTVKKILLTGHQNNSLQIWQTQPKLTKVTTIDTQHTGGVKVIAMSGDGQSFATAGGDNNVRLWLTAKGVKILTLPHQNPVTALSFSQDGKFLLTGTIDGNVKLWNLQAKSVEQIAMKVGKITAIALSPDSQLIAIAMQPGGIQIWQKNPQKLVKSITVSSTLQTLTFLNQKTLVSGNQILTFWDIASGKPAKMFNGYAGKDNQQIMYFTPKIVLTSDSNKSIKIWQVPF
jgi:serine/threonine protein kinase